MRTSLLLALAASLLQCGNLISTDLELVTRLLGDGARGSIRTASIPLGAEDESDVVTPMAVDADIYLPPQPSSSFPTVVSFTSLSKSARLRWPWGAFLGGSGNRSGFVSRYAQIGYRLAAQGIALVVVDLPADDRHPNTGAGHSVACGHEQFEFVKANAISWLLEQPWCDAQRLGSLGLGPGDSTCNEMWALHDNALLASQTLRHNLRAAALFMTPFDVFDEHYAPGGDPVRFASSATGTLSRPPRASFPSWVAALKRNLRLPLWLFFEVQKQSSTSLAQPDDDWHAATTGDDGDTDTTPFATGYREDYAEDLIGAMFPASRWATVDFQNNIPTLSIASWHVGATVRGASRRHLAREQSSLSQSSHYSSQHRLVVGSWDGADDPLEVMARADVQHDISDFFAHELLGDNQRKDEEQRDAHRVSRVQFAMVNAPGFQGENKSPLPWVDTHWPFEARIVRTAAAQTSEDEVPIIVSSSYVGLGLSNEELWVKESQRVLHLEPNAAQHALDITAMSPLAKKKFDISNLAPRKKVVIPATMHHRSGDTISQNAPVGVTGGIPSLRFTSAPLALSVRQPEDSGGGEDTHEAAVRILGTPQLRLQITTTAGAPRDATIHAWLTVGPPNTTTTATTSAVLSKGRLRIGAGKSGVGEGPYLDVPGAPWRSFSRRDDVPRLPGKMSVVTIPMEPLAAVLSEGDVVVLTLWLEMDSALLNATKLSMWVGGMGGSGLKLPIV